MAVQDYKQTSWGDLIGLLEQDRSLGEHEIRELRRTVAERNDVAHRRRPISASADLIQFWAELVQRFVADHPLLDQDSSRGGAKAICFPGDTIPGDIIPGYASSSLVIEPIEITGAVRIDHVWLEVEEGIVFRLTPQCGAILLYLPEDAIDTKLELWNVEAVEDTNLPSQWPMVVYPMRRRVNGKDEIIAVYPSLDPTTYMLYVELPYQYSDPRIKYFDSRIRITVFRNHVSEYDVRSKLQHEER